MERLDTLNFSKELLNNYSYLLKSYEIFFFFFSFPGSVDMVFAKLPEPRIFLLF